MVLARILLLTHAEKPRARWGKGPILMPRTEVMPAVE